MATLAGDIRGVLTQTPPLPIGLDGSRLALWRLRNGRTYEQVRSMTANGFQDYKEEMLTVWSDVVTVTDRDYFRYPNGGTLIAMAQRAGGEKTETVRGFNSGHMINLQPYGQGVGGDWRYFRDTVEEEVLATVRAIVQSGRNLFDGALLTRAMTTTENLLGTSGYDVPFCNGNPTVSGIVYTPPQWNGKVFDTTHTHYQNFDSGAGKTLDDVFASLALNI